MKRAATVLMLLSMLAASAGCDLSDACDPGYYEEHGTCLRERVADSGADAAPAPDDDAGELADAEPADPFDGIGQDCSDATDCPAHLVCGGDMLPLCTLANCDVDDPSSCPIDWTCLDVAGLSPDPSIMSICIMF